MLTYAIVGKTAVGGPALPEIAALGKGGILERPFRRRTLLKIRRRLLCLPRDDDERELLSAGTFVIGSDDRSPLVDNSPFAFRTIGKWPRGLRAGLVTTDFALVKTLIH